VLSGSYCKIAEPFVGDRQVALVGGAGGLLVAELPGDGLGPLVQLGGALGVAGIAGQVAEPLAGDGQLVAGVGGILAGELLAYGLPGRVS
jgi:hypothetical protein